MFSKTRIYSINDIASKTCDDTTNFPPKPPNVSEENKILMNTSNWQIVYMTQKWYQIIRCLDEGRCKTTETAIISKNGVEYHIKFNLYFRYDRYNGMDTEDPKITYISKNDIKDVTETEWMHIIQLIKQNYKKIQ